MSTTPNNAPEPESRTRVFVSAFVAFVLSLALLHSESRAAESIKSADFAELHKLIQPSEEESAWLSINWHTDLWKAREKAAAEGKPILLWEMDGHPLGCT
jgi:hypothetical protein